MGHTKPLMEILQQQLTIWSTEAQVQVTLTPIQDGWAQEICWLLYTTKQLNCSDLAQAISTAIGLPTAAHFKQIHSGRKTGTKASAVHLMVANKDMGAVAEWLEQIYGKTRMKESATTFPLGQQLLLAPLMLDLNKKLGRVRSAPAEASYFLQRDFLCHKHRHEGC